MKSSNPTEFRQPAIAYINGLLSHCSLHCLRLLARVIGFVASHSNNHLRRAARDNLQLVYPHKDDQARKQLMQQSLYHTACALMETAFLWHRPIDEVLGRVTRVDIDKDFLNDQGPAIVVAPHLGSWEFLNLWLSAQRPMMSLYKPARDAALDRYIRQGRSRSGAELLPTDHRGLRQLLRGLKNGKNCMILPDQKPGRDRGSVESEFFGLRVDSPSLVGQLQQRAGCNLYIAAALRDLPGHGFHILLRPLVLDYAGEDQAEASRQIDRAMERLIAEAPDQYQWAYRRFRKTDYSVVETARNCSCR